MLTDRYDNPLTTQSTTAQDAYISAIDLFLSTNTGSEEAFSNALAADENFALAHLGLARHYQLQGNAEAARDSLATAESFGNGLSNQETSQLAVLGTLIRGDSPAAYQQARAHLQAYPRDAMVAQTCMGVFGLIGFSGRAGRQAEQLALAESLRPHYGDDWWFLSALSFAEMEAGQLEPAAQHLARAITLNPRNANAAHHCAHLYYEQGETTAGVDYLQEWLQGYDKSSPLHGHLYWHLALWALAQGNTAKMWELIDSHVAPGASTGPAINQLTDTAAILYRAELAGVQIPNQRWQSLSQYASQAFPEPGVVFADTHSALTHAMAGNGEALTKIMHDSKGPLADTIRHLGESFSAIASQDWEQAITRLVKVMADHERIGGSRAQRDLIEYSLANALLRNGHADEARRLLSIHRPLTATDTSIKGL